MQELRLVGVDGEHLRLSGEQGGSYSLPIDDDLRRALTRDSSTTAGQPAASPTPRPAKAPVPLTPRDIQARIRSGATAEQVAADSGLDLQHVRRYEGPVRAERDYVAYLAQRVEVASPLPSHDGYRSAFGDEPAQLGDMVAYRVRSYGVDTGGLEWDSWRRPDGSWHVVALFDLPEGSRVDLGEQPPAWWTYNPTRKTVANGNRWAQVLSELEPLDGPLPSRRLSAVADRVFDFEAVREAGDESEPPGEDGSPSPAEDQDSLLDVLRSRRGQRLGTDEEQDDALAVLLTRGAVPAAHPRDGELQDDEPPSDDGGGPVVPGLSLAPEADRRNDDVTGHSTGGGSGATDRPSEHEVEQHDDGTPRLYDGVSTDTREISIFARPSKGGRSSRDDQASAESEGNRTDAGRSGGKDDAEPAAERRAKPKRSSVPSWDDIVFGRRSD